MHPFEIPECEEGQGLVEYSLILLFVALAVVAVLGLMGTAVLDFFQDLVEQMGNLPTSS